MSKEVLHFTYDVEFVVKISIKILTEKKLYNSKTSTIKVNGFDYDRNEVKIVYGNDIVDKKGILETQAMNFLIDLLPSGGTITDKILNKLTNRYLSYLTLNKIKQTYFTKNSGTCYDGYVECFATNQRIKCGFGEHYDIVTAVLCDFFGADSIQKQEYTNKELADFVRNNIKISSAFSTVDSIAMDIEREGIYKPVIRREVIRKKYSI